MFFSKYFSFPCQYHSAIPPFSFIHLPPTLLNIFLLVHFFSPVRIFLPLLHTLLFLHVALTWKRKVWYLGDITKQLYLKKSAGLNKMHFQKYCFKIQIKKFVNFDWIPKSFTEAFYYLANTNCFNTFYSKFNYAVLLTQNFPDCFHNNILAYSLFVIVCPSMPTT